MNIEQEFERLKGHQKEGESEFLQLKEELGNSKNIIAERDE